MPVDYISQWEKGFKETPLTRQSFLELLDGKIPYIREAGFLSSDVAQKFEDILVPKLTPYLHATGPTLLKVGVAQFEFLALSEADLQNRPENTKEGYFHEVEKNSRLHEELVLDEDKVM